MEESEKRSGLLEALCSTISERDPFQRKMLADGMLSLAPGSRQAAEKYMRYCLAEGATIDGIADEYLELVRSLKEEQLFFVREGRYRHKCFENVRRLSYDASGYRGIMRALALAMYILPHLQEIYPFFQKNLPTGRAEDAYLEVGPGHGQFFCHALDAGGYGRYVGVDVSANSIEMTRSLLESGMFGKFSGYELWHGDFLDFTIEERYAAIVMGEVLEHVGEPWRFVDKTAQLLAPGGFAFMTTCLNSPAVEHIFLFETLEEVEALFEKAGLRIVERLVLPYHGRTMEQCLRRRLPLNVAYSLTTG